MKKLFSFQCYCGRMGSLAGRFVLDDDGQAQLESLYGTEVYFGEVLGKHSEIIVTLERNHVAVVTDDQGFLDMADKLGVSLNSGFNPLDYAEEESDDESEDAEEES